MTKTSTALKTRKKLPKWAKITLTAVVAVIGIGYFGVGWYFSNKLIVLKPQIVEYDQTVVDVSGKSFTFRGSAYDVDGIIGGFRASAHGESMSVGLYGAPTNKDDATKTSSRPLADDTYTGPLPAKGEKVSLQGNIWLTDPKKALNLDFRNITYQSPVGEMDAWFVPAANSKKWTIAVHGIGAPKQEMLRFIKPVVAAGNNMLIINYRGDLNNPASPDGYTHLGDTEWQDLEAAVKYAKAHGATDIQLYAVSLGGSLAETYLRRSADSSTKLVSKVILDSPALDWEEILAYRVKKLGYPAFLSQPGMTVSSLRAGINFKRITTAPGSLKHPTLIIHNRDDRTVPQAASTQVAKAQPDLVQFVDFGSGGHTRAWNNDPLRYEILVTNFLKQ